jgi:diguanylate cyclase (GGDEF)-like protein
LKDADQIAAIAERLRVLVESAWVPLADCSLHVTISLGVTLARLQDSPETLIQRADDLMYRSKTAGRNRISYG